MSETVVTTEGQVDDTDDLAAFSDDFFGRKPAEGDKETKSPVEQEVKDKAPEETDVLEEDVNEADKQDEEELKEEIPQEPPKRKTVQDRIDEVVRQREELRRESAAELQKLRDEIEAMKK